MPWRGIVIKSDVTEPYIRTHSEHWAVDKVEGSALMGASHSRVIGRERVQPILICGSEGCGGTTMRNRCLRDGERLSEGREWISVCLECNSHKASHVRPSVVDHWYAAAQCRVPLLAADEIFFGILSFRYFNSPLVSSFVYSVRH